MKVPWWLVFPLIAGLIIGRVIITAWSDSRRTEMIEANHTQVEIVEIALNTGNRPAEIKYRFEYAERCEKALRESQAKTQPMPNEYSLLRKRQIALRDALLSTELLMEVLGMTPRKMWYDENGYGRHYSDWALLHPRELIEP